MNTHVFIDKYEMLLISTDNITEALLMSIRMFWTKIKNIPDKFIFFHPKRVAIFLIYFQNIYCGCLQFNGRSFLKAWLI